MSVELVSSCRLPTKFGEFRMLGFWDEENQKEHIALVMGDVSAEDSVLTRVHSECLTGDALFSQRCDCGSQLNYALQKISQRGVGVILYLRQEGRGIGLLNKVKAYALQDQGADTVEANEELGFGADLRDYSMCGPMCESLQIKTVSLLTNNPKKVEALKVLGIDVSERLPIETGQTPHNAKYLATKAGKLGHLFDQ